MGHSKAGQNSQVGRSCYRNHDNQHHDREHRGKVTAAHISRDGKQVVTTGGDDFVFH